MCIDEFSFVSLLYTAALNNFDSVSRALHECIGAMIQSTTWRDTTPGLSPVLQNTLDGVTVFRTVSVFLLQYARL